MSVRVKRYWFVYEDSGNSFAFESAWQLGEFLEDMGEIGDSYVIEYRYGIEGSDGMVWPCDDNGVLIGED